MPSVTNAVDCLHEAWSAARLQPHVVVVDRASRLVLLPNWRNPSNRELVSLPSVAVLPTTILCPDCRAWVSVGPSNYIVFVYPTDAHGPEAIVIAEDRFPAHCCESLGATN